MMNNVKKENNEVKKKQENRFDENQNALLQQSVKKITQQQQYLKTHQQRLIVKILILYAHYGPNYRAIQFHLTKNQMRSIQSNLKRTISKIVSQGLREIEKKGRVYKAINYTKMSSQQHKEVLNLLLSKFNRRNLRLTNYLRAKLVHYIKASYQSSPLDLQQFIKVYQYLAEWKNSYFSGLLRGGKSMRHFSWSKQQIQKLHQLYLIYGDEKKVIREKLSESFQLQEKYEPSLIHSKLITLFTQALKVISNQLIKKGSSLQIDSTVTTSKHFICSRQQTDFDMIRQLLNCRKLKQFHENQLFKLKQFILTFMSKKKIVKRHRSKCVVQLQQPGSNIIIQ